MNGKSIKFRGPEIKNVSHTMSQIKVKSSYIDSIGYNVGTLKVVYKDGKMYRYAGVPADLYRSIMSAESVGKALQEQALKGGFEVEKVESETGEIE